MKAYNGTGDLVPLTLNLGTRKRRVGSCLSRWLYTWRKLLAYIDEEVGWAPEPV